MKKLLLLLLMSSSFNLWAQKDTLTLVISKPLDAFMDKDGVYSDNLDKGLANIVKTTPLVFFCDNLGIKAEFVKCYFDTAVIKTATQKEEAMEMIKKRYVKAQADYLRLNQQFFPEIVGTDLVAKPFSTKDFLGKTTVIGIHSGFKNSFLEPMYQDLETLSAQNPNIYVALLTDAMAIEVEQSLNRPARIPVLPNAGDVCEANLGQNYPLSYFVVLDKNGKVKNFIFMYDSAGVFSYSDGYNVYNLEMLKKSKQNFSFLEEIRRR
jgi:hypothetical protein